MGVGGKNLRGFLQIHVQKIIHCTNTTRARSILHTSSLVSSRLRRERLVTVALIL